MQVNLYSIYDRKAQYYLPLFQASSDAQAERQFAQIVTQSETDVSKYPADFDLVRLGALNVETGYIEPEQPIGLIINGLVSLQAANSERNRYKKALDNPQVDLEDLIAGRS